MNKTLIVSYYFKPDKSIGSKRWSSISDYLEDKNSLYLISATQNADGSNFAKSFYINSKYPKVLDSFPHSILNKIEYRIALRKQKRITKGSLYDRGVNCSKELLDRMSLIVEKENINNVIITGAPFSWLNTGAQLKSKYPEINLICDFRDPWTWGQGYGFNQLDKKRKTHEVVMEKNVIETSNKITVPSKAMLNYLKKNYPKHADKITHLPHGFDKQKIDTVLNKIEPAKNKNLTLIYAGTIYENTENQFINFLETLRTLNIKFVFNIYSRSSCPQKLSQFEEVNYQGFVPETVMFEKILLSDYYLMAYPEKFKDFLSAKFYEIIYLQKKIIYIGAKGAISDLIVENNLGAWIQNFDKKNTLNHLNDLEKLKKTNFNIDKYSFEYISTEFKKNCLNQNK
ncbi:glycosyltransferase family protein [Crocinitomix catalasitica]|uniref:hypothetical protein n=1 Tax=Crocinitomix catalasitica TaxID=184607 RepID=UPI000489E0F3|nr:hypothetical protein [Crocinitomix catalasitica]